MGIHVEGQSAFRSALGYRLGLKRINAGVLKGHLSGALSAAGRPCEIALNARPETIQLYCV